MPGWAIALIIIGSLAVLGIPILGIMAAISIPAFMQARNSARRNACVSNLRQIEAAKDEYALEYGGTNGSQFTWANVSLYIKNADTKIFCPAAPVGERSLNNYEIGPLGTDPECKVDTEKHRL